MEVVTLNSSFGEDFTHKDLLGGVRDYVQDKNIEYVDSLSVIKIFTIEICTLVLVVVNIVFVGFIVFVAVQTLG